MLFDGVHFGSDFQIDPPGRDVSKRLLSAAELAMCREWVGANLNAIQIGATPMYYAMGVSDLKV